MYIVYTYIPLIDIVYRPSFKQQFLGEELHYSSYIQSEGPEIELWLENPGPALSCDSRSEVIKHPVWDHLAMGMGDERPDFEPVSRHFPREFQ